MGERKQQAFSEEENRVIISLEIRTSHDFLPWSKRKNKDEDGCGGDDEEHIHEDDNNDDHKNDDNKGDDEEEDDDFEVIVTAKIMRSSKPERPITLDVWHSPLHSEEPWYNGDTFGRYEIALRRYVEARRYQSVDLGYHCYPQIRDCTGHGPDIRGHPRYKLLTIPAIGQGALEVRHKLPWWRIFHEQSKMSKYEDEVEAGERWRLCLSSNRWIERTSRWWCWGDVDGDLKNKLLSYDTKSKYISRGSRCPTAEELAKTEGLVLGEDYNGITAEMSKTPAWVTMG